MHAVGLIIIRPTNNKKCFSNATLRSTDSETMTKELLNTYLKLSYTNKNI